MSSHESYDKMTPGKRHKKEDGRKGVEQAGPLTVEETKLIRSLRAIPWGEAQIVMKHGKPVMLKRQVEDVKLTD